MSHETSISNLTYDQTCVQLIIGRVFSVRHMFGCSRQTRHKDMYSIMVFVCLKKAN